MRQPVFQSSALLVVGFLLRQTTEAGFQTRGTSHPSFYCAIEGRQESATCFARNRRISSDFTTPEGVQRFIQCKRKNPFSSNRISKDDALFRVSMMPTLSSDILVPSIWPAGTMSALLLLFSSSTIGIWADYQPKLQGSGILATLLVAAVFSNQGLVPIHHPLYDLAWTTFLPASLVLLLLSTSRQHQSGSEDVLSDTRKDMLESIRRVGVAFIVGCLGSILGCFGSFWACRRQLRPSVFFLSPQQAALAAGCLCASYIGGSVNFFATARIITSTGNAQHDPSSSSLLGAMATADLVVMAIYFAVMASALQSKLLQRLFAGSGPGNESLSNDGFLEDGLLVKNQPDLAVDISSPQRLDAVRKGFATLLVSSLALSVVTFANKLDSVFSIILPGTACAVIALATPLLSAYLGSLGRKSANFLSLWDEMKNQSRRLSEFTFHLLFAAIGASANLGKGLKAGPACLLFSLFALTIHAFVIVAGSWGLQRGIPGIPKISWNDVLIASNAAIGGPATAATFAGRLPTKHGVAFNRTTFGLTMAATFWGVVGYAVGTVIGTQLTQTLLQTL